MIIILIDSDFECCIKIGLNLLLDIMNLLLVLKNCLINYDILIISILPNFRLVFPEFCRFPGNDHLKTMLELRFGYKMILKLLYHNRHFQY